MFENNEASGQDDKLENENLVPMSSHNHIKILNKVYKNHHSELPEI